MKKTLALLVVLITLTLVSTAQAAQSAPSLPTLDDPACAGAKLASALVDVPIVRSCDKDHNGSNDCQGKNPYQCSLACLGLTGIDLDANMRMPVDQGNGTCARSNLENALLWKGEVAPGNDRPGEGYLDPRKPLPSGVLLFGAYRTRQFLVNTKIDYCDSALGDLQRCAQERDALQTKLARLEVGFPSGTAAVGTISQPEYDLMVAVHQQADARIQAGKQCHLQGRQYVFGGNRQDDRCEPARSAGVLQSQWWPVGIATIFALLFGVMLWKWWQDRYATTLARNNLHLLRLSMKELLIRSDAMLNLLKAIAQELGVNVNSNLAELTRKLKAAHDGQAVEMRHTRTTLQFGSGPELGASLEYSARQIVDDLTRTRKECEDQAARIVALTKEGHAEREPQFATRGEVAAIDLRVERLETLEARCRGLRNYLPDLQYVDHRLHKAKSEEVRAVRRRIQDLMQEIEAFPVQEAPAA